MIDTFWLILGYACNNGCAHCYVGNISKKISFKNMSIVYARDVIDAMSSVGAKQCLLIGGEPTLYRELNVIIKYLCLMNIKPVLITNGRQLADIHYLSNLLDSGLDRITISIEGSTKEIHNQVTNSESFLQTIQGIKNCIALDCQFTTLTTIAPLNRQDCQNIPIVMNDLGVKNIYFNCFIPPAKLEGNNLDEFLSPKILAESIMEIYDNSERHGIKVGFNCTIPACLFDEYFFKKLVESKSIDLGCQMYVGRGVAFDPFGNILPCTHFSDFPLLNNAKNAENRFIFKKNIKDVWIGKNLNPTKFRKKLWRYPSPVCQQCDLWGACIGGCPLFWLYYDPAQYILKPFKMK